MAIREIGASITLDNNQFKKEMSAVNSNLSGLQAEMKAVTAEFADNAKSADALAAKDKILSQQEEQQRVKVEALTRAYDEQAKATGEDSVEADRLRKSLNNARADLAKTEKAHRENTKALDEATKKAQEYTPANEKAAKAVQELRKKLDEKVAALRDAAKHTPVVSESLAALGAAGKAAQKGLSLTGDALKATAEASVAAVAATAAFGAAFLKAVDDVASYGDEIDKASQKMGLSAEAYQEWDAILQHSGSSMDAMKNSMTTLAKAAVSGSDAFDALGLSQEEVAAMNQEDLFSATITALQNVTDETQRTVLANQLLGGGAKELGALLNTSAEDTEAMRQRVHDLGGVMSDEAVKAAAAYEDSIQDLKTAFAGLKRGALQDAMPAVSMIVDGITDTLAGGDGSEKISDGLRQLLDDAFKGAAEDLDGVLDMGMEIINTLLDAIEEYAPDLADAAVQIIMSLGEFLLQNAPQLLSSGMSMVSTLIQGLTNALPQLIPMAAQMIVQLATGLVSNTPELIKTGLQLILALVQGLVEAIPELLASVPELIDGLKEGFQDAWPQIKELGLSIVNGIWEGLVSAWESVKSWFTGAIGSLSGNAHVGIETDGSHAGGLDYVPFDGYVAELHRGERVLTAAENAAYSRGSGGGRSVTVNVTTQELSPSTVEYLIRRVNEELGGDVS